ncbi:uncharacterized protein L199_001285 [Kwoniella botswanensis]|uniref:uncharacterized protein n=1 Tax=Kwoniella botswanensis TaxID=1268659 RepID=UPI00315CA57C
MDENEFNRFWRDSYQNGANLNQLGQSDEANNEGWQAYTFDSPAIHPKGLGTIYHKSRSTLEIPTTRQMNDSGSGSCIGTIKDYPTGRCSSNHLGAATNSQLSDVGTMSAFDSPGHNQAEWDTLGSSQGEVASKDENDPNPKNRKDITRYISSAINQTKRLRAQIARRTGETPSSNVGVGDYAGRVHTEYSTMLRDTKRKTAYLEELMKQSGHDDPFVSFARTGYKPYDWKADSVALSTMRDRIGKMKTINSSLDKDIELQETRRRTQNTSDRSSQYQGDSARDRLQSHHDNLLAHLADRETSLRTLRSAD